MNETSSSEETELYQIEPQVYLVDDHNDLRESMTFMLESLGLTVHSYPNGHEFLLDLPPAACGCAIVDYQMDGLSGIDVLRQLRERKSPLTVIILTAHGDVPLAVESMRLGAFHFLQKGGKEDQIIQCVKDAIQIARQESSRNWELTQVDTQLQNLSKRENQVLEHVIRGETSRNIADYLGISVKTVDAHRSNVMKKLEVNNTAELIHKVVRFRHDTSEE
ncbi:MAG: response regulator transcription factor [Planctomycetaceae bacterium]|nr:response regulator transcription factor [Planctomycetaceae bacterium]